MNVSKRDKGISYYSGEMKYCDRTMVCCALILHCTYPAVPLFFFALTLLCTYPAFRLPLTLLCPYYFLRTYLAVPLSRFTITTYPAVPLLFFFALTPSTPDTSSPDSSPGKTLILVGPSRYGLGVPCPKFSGLQEVPASS